MNKLLLSLFVLFLFSNPASASNETDCKRWCERNAQCEKCSTHIGCGAGYKQFRKFNGPGDNWFACKLTNFRQRGEGNREACNRYCRGSEECKYCSAVASCGRGYSSIRAFNGPGKNWWACKQTGFRQRGEQNRIDCANWCRENRESGGSCVMCSDRAGCGRGYTSKKSFNGPGKNWFACKVTKAVATSNKHKRWCESFCERNGICEKCSDRIGCGPGFSNIASFSHRGGDRWFACAKSGGRFGSEIIGKQQCEDWIANADLKIDVIQYCSRTCGAGLTPIANIGGWRACTDTRYHQARERNYNNCRRWCDENSACSKCSTFAGCGAGYRRLKTFTGGIYEDYFYACERR